MASNKLIVFALVMIAVVGLASAADKPATPAPTTAAAGPADDDMIGTEDGGAASAPAAGGDGEVAPGPLGSAAANNATPAGTTPPASGASVLEVSAIAGVAIVVGYLF